MVNFMLCVYYHNFKNKGASLVVQWLGLCPTKAEGHGSNPGRELRVHTLQGCSQK